MTPSSIKAKVARVLELIVQEAGGLVTDFAGNHGYLESGNILAGNRKFTPKRCAAYNRT